jgi:hypothetical protein
MKEWFIPLVLKDNWFDYWIEKIFQNVNYKKMILKYI